MIALRALVRSEQQHNTRGKETLLAMLMNGQLRWPSGGVTTETLQREDEISALKWTAQNVDQRWERKMQAGGKGNK